MSNGTELTHINKKQRTDDTTTLTTYNNNDTQLSTHINGHNKQSILPAPTIQLNGHSSYIYTAQFSPDGLFLASAGADRQIFVWSCKHQFINSSVLNGHSKAIQQLIWHNDCIYTASADNTVQVFDVQAEQRIKKINRIHKQCVNTVAYNTAHNTIFSGSDDCTVVGCDTRYKKCYTILQQYPILSIDTHDNNIYCAGIDNQIYCYDIRKFTDTADNITAPLYTLYGHSDSVTGISISHNKQYLCSTSHDNSIIIHDINSYVSQNRSRTVSQFQGGVHDKQMNLLRVHWSNNDKHISCGSSNTITYIFDAQTHTVKYQLPGHTGSVNEIDFHPTEPVIVSCSNDKTMYVQELALL